MGLWESALILLGVGILSSKMEAGKGLGELGTGIQTLIAAPLVGTGAGLSTLAGGLRDIFETFGDLGRGISAVFAGIPKWALPGYVGPGGAGSGLLPSSGGDDTDLLPGGGGNVPNGVWTPDIVAMSWLSTSPPPAGQTLWMTRQENGYWRYAPNVG